MGLSVQINDGKMLICNLPSSNVKRGKELPIIRAMDPNPRVDRSPVKYQKIAHKKNQNLNSLMDCKHVDKFDHGTHKDYPRAKPEYLRPMSRGEVQAYIMAGAEIRYDRQTFQRKVCFQNHVLGSCTMADITAFMRAGLVREYGYGSETVFKK